MFPDLNETLDEMQSANVQEKKIFDLKLIFSKNLEWFKRKKTQQVHEEP